jgi:hypothetical protein
MYRNRCKLKQPIRTVFEIKQCSCQHCVTFTTILILIKNIHLFALKFSLCDFTYLTLANQQAIVLFEYFTSFIYNVLHQINNVSSMSNLTIRQSTLND